MQLDEVMAQLESTGTEQNRKVDPCHGATFPTSTTTPCGSPRSSRPLPSITETFCTTPDATDDIARTPAHRANQAAKRAAKNAKKAS